MPLRQREEVQEVLRSMRDAIPKRLYRGIRERYDPEKVGTTGGRQGLAMTDFTDCPWSALRFAHGRKGYVLVLHPPHDPESERPALRVTEEMWGLRDNGPKRYVVWGRFDDLRAGVARRGADVLPHDRHAGRRDLAVRGL